MDAMMIDFGDLTSTSQVPFLFVIKGQDVSDYLRGEMASPLDPCWPPRLTMKEHLSQPLFFVGGLIKGGYWQVVDTLLQTFSIFAQEKPYCSEINDGLATEAVEEPEQSIDYHN